MTPTTAYAVEIRAVADMLNGISIGDTCPYSDMSELIGRDVRQCRHIVLAAIRMLNKESGALFAAVRKVGYQRIAPQDAHTFGATTRGRIRRSARRTASMIGVAIDKANDMSDEAKRRAMGEIGTLTMLAHLATEKTVTAVAAFDKPQPVAVTMAATLRAMGGGTP